jgi:predicted nucleic acid-binding protein
MPFVLDNSAVTAWYIADQATDYAESIATKLETDLAIVPALWQLEFANVLKTGCTRDKLSIDTARQVVEAIWALPIACQDAKLRAAAMAASVTVI